MAVEQQVQQLSDLVLQLQQNQARLEQENHVLRESQGGVTMLASAVGELAKSLEKKEGRRKSQILMDTKGLGRPESFGNVEGEFRKWAKSIDKLFVTTFGREFIEILEFILEQEDAIEISRMESEFGAGTVADLDDLEDKADQIHHVLLTLTSGETEDLMAGASSGFEAYRRVHRRWDPRTSGRKRNILRAILQPERVKTWTAVRPAIEQLEELIRRYEARRNASRVRETLSDDIKSASLEMLVPPHLEKHLLLNKSRLTSYALIKQEIELVIESSLTSKSSVPKPGSSSSSYQGPQPMDVDSIGQWIASPVKGRVKEKVNRPKVMERKAQAKEAQVKAQKRLKRSPAIIAVRRDIERPTAGAGNGRMGKATNGQVQAKETRVAKEAKVVKAKVEKAAKAEPQAVWKRQMIRKAALSRLRKQMSECSWQT